MRVMCLTLAILIFATGVHSQSDLPPYIHYYSQLHDGLFIERADGTDSRIIPDVPGGPDWSPSGKWMLLGGSMVSRTDGSRRISISLHERILSQFSKWAPQEDILLVVGTGLQEGAGSIRIQLFDVEEETILGDFELARVDYDPPYDIRSHWSLNGQRAYVHWSGHLVTLYRDGRSILKTNLRRWDSLGDYPFDFYKGRFLYRVLVEETRAAVVVEDVESNRRIELADQCGQRRCSYRVRWSPTQTHALVSTRACDDDTCENTLRLVDWESGAVTPVTPVVRLLAHDDNACSFRPDCSALWSPGGNFAILTDENDTVYVLDVTTGKTRPIATGTLYYGWTPDEKLLITYSGSNSISYYDPASDHEQDILLPVGATLYKLDPSPDGQYIALRSFPPVIIDLHGEIVSQTLPHSHSAKSYSWPEYGYRWHPDQDWVMADYNIFFSGGGIGPSASLVFDLDNTVRRELPTGGSAGFVPDRAIPYLASGQPTSVKKDPLFTLPQAGLVYGVGWHPTDPDQFVTYSKEAGLLFWSLASGQPAIINQMMPEVPYPRSDPLGLKLFWLPDRGIIAFYENGELRHIEASTGNIVPVADSAYPIFTLTDDQAAIHYATSDEVLHLDADSSMFGLPALLTSDRTAFIIHGAQVFDNPYYVNAYMGTIVQLDIPEKVYYTVDARDSIAALGNGYDCCIVVVNTDTGDMMDEFYGTAFSLALSSDSRRLATTSQGMTAIWDMSAYVSKNKLE